MFPQPCEKVPGLGTDPVSMGYQMKTYFTVHLRNGRGHSIVHVREIIVPPALQSLAFAWLVVCSVRFAQAWRLGKLSSFLKLLINPIA